MVLTTSNHEHSSSNSDMMQGSSSSVSSTSRTSSSRAADEDPQAVAASVEESEEELWYFGYGPIVNDLVRQRRGIQTLNMQAAYLEEYRLTFAFGGNANIVAKRGFQVHGVLMQLATKEDWQKLCDFETGHTPTVRQVIPYAQNENDVDNNSSEEDDEDADDANPKRSITAFLIEMPENVDDTLLDAPIERLPQERYLKLIAQGMQKYHVDEDYIQDEILAVPFVPTRTPSEYRQFPLVDKKKKKTQKRGLLLTVRNKLQKHSRPSHLPKISWSKYQMICQKAKVVEGDLYFVLGQTVLRVGEHDPANPCAMWLEEHGHGKADVTYRTYMTVVDPDLPVCQSKNHVTPQHIAWAENHLVELLENYALTATKVYTLTQEDKQHGSSVTTHSTSLTRSTSGRSLSNKKQTTNPDPTSSSSIQDQQQQQQQLQDDEASQGSSETFSGGATLPKWWPRGRVRRRRQDAYFD